MVVIKGPSVFISFSSLPFQEQNSWKMGKEKEKGRATGWKVGRRVSRGLYEGVPQKRVQEWKSPYWACWLRNLQVMISVPEQALLFNPA